jgi:hypothetical protein
MWNEDELITYEQAAILVNNYLTYSIINGNINYVSLGEVMISGSSQFQLRVTNKFPARSIAYSKADAERGGFEKVCIKKVQNVKGTVIYTDTLNVRWKESELVTYAEAAVLVANS